MTDLKQEVSPNLEARAREALEILVVTYAMEDAQGATNLEAPILQLLAEREALREENAHLSDRVSEAEQQPWPEWADDIRKKLIECGVEAGDEGGWNIGADFEEWLDACLEEVTRRSDAENLRLRTRIEGLEGALERFARHYPNVNPEYEDKARIHPYITCGDIRAARSSLNQTGGGL